MRISNSQEGSALSCATAQYVLRRLKSEPTTKDFLWLSRTIQFHAMRSRHTRAKEGCASLSGSGSTIMPAAEPAAAFDRIRRFACILKLLREMIVAPDLASPDDWVRLHELLPVQADPCGWSKVAANLCRARQYIHVCEDGAAHYHLRQALAMVRRLRHHHRKRELAMGFAAARHS